MSIVDQNHYAPPLTNSFSTHASRRPSLWILIPSAILFVIGVISFLIGMFAVIMLEYLFYIERGSESFLHMLAGCSLYLGLGVSWMLAAWSFWRRRIRTRAVSILIGIVIPIVLFSILGF